MISHFRGIVIKIYRSIQWIYRFFVAYLPTSQKVDEAQSRRDHMKKLASDLIAARLKILRDIKASTDRKLQALEELEAIEDVSILPDLYELLDASDGQLHEKIDNVIISLETIKKL